MEQSVLLGQMNCQIMSTISFPDGLSKSFEEKFAAGVSSGSEHMPLAAVLRMSMRRSMDIVATALEECYRLSSGSSRVQDAGQHAVIFVSVHKNAQNTVPVLYCIGIVKHFTRLYCTRLYRY